MKYQIIHLLASVSLYQMSNAGIASEITVLEEGYNFIAKLPCLGCPFLYQDTSRAEDRPWTERQDDNALLLNISLSYDAMSLTVNNRQIYPSNSRLPQIYANQIVQDLSDDALAEIVSTDQLEASHETNLGGGFFGISYSQTARQVQDSAALLFQFDIFEIWSDLPPAPLQHKLQHKDQKMLEFLLLQKPVMSALDPVSFEIIKASLVPRTPLKLSSNLQTMHFLEWDSFGRKGTPSHFLSWGGSALLDWMDSGLWALFTLVFCVMALFILVCIVCIFGCSSFWQDDYAQAQHGKGKARRKKSRGHWDVEGGRKMTFKSAEELGLLGRGRVVGVGKSD